ncbi:MAG: DnaJ domain-containing protein [Gallionella sp.]|nr:DnaJ domain-containing protein [Gallionella sp.]
MNSYEILEVSPNASQEVLKAAYKSLMQRYHPDKNPGDDEAAAHSSSIVQAYEMLSDPGRRAAYDVELKRQQELLWAQAQPRKIPQPISRPAKKKGMPGSFAWLFAVAAAWVVWYVGTSSEIKQSQTPVVKDANLQVETLPSDTQQIKVNEPALGLDARTIPRFIQDIKVNLNVVSEPMNGAAVDATHILNITELSVIVGTFDSSQFISFIQDNRKIISQQLTARLADAKYERLMKPDGEQYLKQIILDAIGDITGTNRHQVYPSNDTGVPAHYGVVDVLLPESFIIKSLQPAPPTTGDESRSDLP